MAEQGVTVSGVAFEREGAPPLFAMEYQGASGELLGMFLVDPLVTDRVELYADEGGWVPPTAGAA